MCAIANRVWHGCAIVLTLSITGCYKKAGIVTTQNSKADSVNVSNVTYSNYIHLVLKNNCSTCHGTTGSAAAFWINTNTYENAVQYGVRIKETIVEGSMPPPPRSPFSQADKNLFTAWIKRGMPE
jgi:uncharacterized membrane protein